MLDEDFVIRCSTFPRGFENHMLAPESIFSFANPNETKTYAMSVGCAHMLLDVPSRHNFGCRTVEAINAARSTRNDRELADSEMEHYLGYYELAYGELMALRNACYAIAVVWCPENGLEEHANVVLYPNGRDATKKQLKAARMDVRKAMVRIARGPTRGVCTNDPKQVESLNSIPLPPLPETI